MPLIKLKFPWKKQDKNKEVEAVEAITNDEEDVIENVTTPHQSFIPKNLAVVVIAAVAVGIGTATYFASARQQQKHATEVDKAKKAEEPEDAAKRAALAKQAVDQAKSAQEQEQAKKARNDASGPAQQMPAQDNQQGGGSNQPQGGNGQQPAAQNNTPNQGQSSTQATNGQQLPPPPPPLKPGAYNPAPLSQTASVQGGDDMVRQRAGAIIALTGVQNQGAPNHSLNAAANNIPMAAAALTNTIVKNAGDQASMMPFSNGMAAQQSRAYPLTMSIEQVRDQLAALRAQVANGSNPSSSGEMPPPPQAVMAQPSLPQANYQGNNAGQNSNAAPFITPVSYDGKLVLRQGSIIPAVTQSAINSDLSGEISALVTENVYDSVGGTTLLIPKGAKLIANYGDDIRLGDERVMINFSRLLFPDGSYILLKGGMNGVDTQGRSGMEADVNNHFLKMFGAGLVAAVVTWGTERTQNNNVTINNPSGSTDLTGPTAKVIKDLTDRMMDRYKSLKPTLVLEPGEKIKLFVKQDMVLPAYNNQ